MRDARFVAAMRLMRSHDPQLREDGFGQLRDRASEYTDELIAGARLNGAIPDDR